MTPISSCELFFVWSVSYPLSADSHLITIKAGETFRLTHFNLPQNTLRYEVEEVVWLWWQTFNDRCSVHIILWQNLTFFFLISLGCAFGNFVSNDQVTDSTILLQVLTGNLIFLLSFMLFNYFIIIKILLYSADSLRKSYDL